MCHAAGIVLLGVFYNSIKLLLKYVFKLELSCYVSISLGYPGRIPGYETSCQVNAVVQMYVNLYKNNNNLDDITLS